MSLNFDVAAADSLVKKINRLHSGPRIAQRLLSITRDSNFDLKKIVECLEHDPALSARVLRVVNSSRYGLTNTVSSVRQAATYLGRRSLRLIVLTFALVDTLSRGSKSQCYADYWRRSFSMATVASQLAQKCPQLSSDDCYTTGLLADVGALVLFQLEGDRYHPIVEKYSHGQELVAAELEVFGFDHAQLGSRLLREWDLPEEVVDAILKHHCQSDDGTPLDLAIRAGNLMSDVLWSENSPHVGAVKQLLSEEFDIDTDEFISMAMHCTREVEESARTFGIDVRQGTGCQQLLDEAENLFSEASIDTAIELDSLESAIEEL